MNQDTVATTADLQSEKSQESKQINKPATSKASTSPCTQEGEDKNAKLVPDYNLLPKVKPKGTCSAFIQYSTGELKKPNSDFGLPDETKHIEKVKVISTRWKEMSDEQKKPYQQLADEDKQRYHKQNEQFKKEGFFINNDGVKSTDILPELKDFPKDTVFPKKKMSQFMVFLAQFDHSKFKEEKGTVQMSEACKYRAEKYAQITEEERAELQKVADTDGQRYDKEVHQLKTLGYFINKDGVKSTDLKKKKGKAEREAEKKEKEQEKERQASDEAKETTGWSYYYQQNFEQTWHDAEGKTEKAKKANVDTILQQKWLDMTDNQKKKIIRDAIKVQNGEPLVKLGKRKKPDNESSSAPVTASEKKQKN